MAEDHITIRDIKNDEIVELTSLINELGYPTTIDEMEIRFKSIAVHPDYKTIVAVSDNHIVGMAGFCKGIYYEKNGCYLRILAFVVKRSSRKNGIGKALMDAAEHWARQQGIHTILLTSGIRDERKAAYEFYKKMGFEIKSSGFVKQL